MTGLVGFAGMTLGFEVGVAGLFFNAEVALRGLGGCLVGIGGRGVLDVLERYDVARPSGCVVGCPW